MSASAPNVWPMARKQHDSYRCSECGWTSPVWVGRCGQCQTWGSVVERDAPPMASVPSHEPVSQAVPIAQVCAQAADRRLTGIGELDRVLGGGLVPGVVVLLAGEPGVGKSTLLLEVAAQWARSGNRTLYITGEESASQVRLRAERTGALADELYLAAENDLGTVLGHIEQTEPTLMVLDSIQTVGAAQTDGIMGGSAQVREVTAALVRVAKARGMAVVIVGHVTKDGAIAGPRTLEHLVDVVLNFEGDRHSGFRMVRAVKNRYGPSDEVGCFEMAERGIVEVPDPSGLFTTRHEEPVPGTCVTVTMEGRRPLLAEVQGLAAKVRKEAPVRRITNGIEFSRVSMVLAVLQSKARLRLFDRDVYVSTVGGARITDPSADLAVAIAVASALVDRNFPHKVLALGEVGLAGDLRRVPGLERRLAEAARLGFELAVVPAGSRDRTAPLPGRLEVVEVSSVAQALGVLDLRRTDRRGPAEGNGG
ncbi:DNA repair protein RadA [Propionibacterium australiense]|uniref:DNA repair protein RadA n=2 Tax=Propionibacterium australiense TaxID=119981 RepID=A0A383S6M3_9ACTN|nr:Ribosomal protein S5 domain 2-type fold, subgroup [Propionibacterium australiense]VEH89334.1 DNA repair protein RadA [Propionibacterium australiense]